MFDWNDLRIFLAVARGGSALAAARDLNLNQTTITRRIDALEHAVGAPLFLRGARGSDLTEQGQALLPYAEAVERAALAFDGEINRQRRDQGGEIRITAPEGAMAVFIGPLTRRYRSLHPDVRFDYVSSEAQLDLAKGEADVALRATRVLEGDTLICQTLPDVHWTAFCSAAYAQRMGVPTGLDALAGHRIIAYTGLPTGLAPVKTFMAHVRPGDLSGSSNSVVNMAGVIRAGIGIGLMPCFMGDTQDGLLRCFAPPEDLKTPWWLVAPREAHQLARVRDFMSWSADRMRQLRGVLSGKLDQQAVRHAIEAL